MGTRRVKLPEITMNDWLEAERGMRGKYVIEKPEGTITTDEFAAMRGSTRCSAADTLRKMVDRGMATRERWLNGKNGGCYVYKLTKKK